MRFSAVWTTCVLVAALGLYAQGQNTESNSAQANEVKGVPPRAAPGDYQAHAQAGAVTVAAEFMGHSVPRLEGPLSTEDYVVVETGLYGAPGAQIKVSLEDFSLRINGKKTALPSQSYVLVTKSLKDPSWVPPEPAEPKSKSSFGTGGQGDNPPPAPVHVPFELRRAMALHVRRTSMPVGERALPEAGLLFFPYRGKSESIHSIELIYAGPTGEATLNLQP
jgi:hypothetical protein